MQELCEVAYLARKVSRAPKGQRVCCIPQTHIVIACKSLNDVGTLEEYKGVKCASPRKFYTF